MRMLTIPAMAASLAMLTACEERIDNEVTRAYDDQAQALELRADQFERQADELEDRADRLKGQASELNDQASQIRKTGQDLAAQVQQGTINRAQAMPKERPAAGIRSDTADSGNGEQKADIR